MSLSSLRRLDFQLLIIFKTVMEHRQLTRAAEELGVTQSALSHALKRLREVIGEDLFVRRQFGMEPTEAALKLIGPVEGILRAAENALQPPAPFDPATSERTFRIAVTPLAAPLILPALISNISEDAPSIRITSHWIGENDPISLLDADTVDLVIAPLCAVPERISARMLMHTNHCVVARKGHPTIGKKFGTKKYLNVAHIKISEPGSLDEPVDRAIASSGLSRRIGLEVPDILSAMIAVRDSDMIMTLPESVARIAGRSFGLRVRPMPLDFPPVISALFIHERHVEEDGIVWLADQIRIISGSQGAG